jgi:hypothetical protein
MDVIYLSILEDKPHEVAKKVILESSALDRYKFIVSLWFKITGCCKGKLFTSAISPGLVKSLEQSYKSM